MIMLLHGNLSDMWIVINHSKCFPWYLCINFARKYISLESPRMYTLRPTLPHKLHNSGMPLGMQCSGICRVLAMAVLVLMVDTYSLYGYAVLFSCQWTSITYGWRSIESCNLVSKNPVAPYTNIIARPPNQPPVILSGTPELGWAPLTCVCWQINSILINYQ